MGQYIQGTGERHALEIARLKIARVFTYRCVYLFFALLLFFVLFPFLGETTRGRVMANLLNVAILIAAVAAMGRSTRSFVIVLLLALPAVAFQVAAFELGEARYLVMSWGCGTAVYAATLIYLLRYVFHPAVMTADKLYGAAAAYFMVGVVWAYLYAILQYFNPGSFAVNGTPVATVVLVDLLYFSFTALTTTGFGDISPVLRPARTIVILESITGVLFVAILIARLAGSYPESGKDGPHA